MPDLVAGDVTITIAEVKTMGRKRYVRGTLAFGDGAKTYPVGGVPMPVIGKFGFYRSMDDLSIDSSSAGHADNFVPRWDSTNNKIQLYAETTVATNQPLIEGTNALAPAAKTYSFVAWGW